MSYTTPPKWWASLSGEYAPLICLTVLVGQLNVWIGPLEPWLKLWVSTLVLTIEQVLPDCCTSSAGKSVPYWYWPIFWLPPGPRPSAVVRPSHCEMTSPVLASMIAVGRAGASPLTKYEVR